MFEASHSSERSPKPLNENRSTDNIPPSVISCQDPESPRLAYKSDTDYGSDCSSRDANSGEDEWMDETRNKTIERERSRGIVSEDLRRMALNDPQESSENNQVKKKVADDSDRNDHEDVSKETSQVDADCSGHSFLLQFHDNGSEFI